MCNDDTATTPQKRNGIQRKGSDDGDYVCNLDQDNIYNEFTDTGDGEWIACNWLSWDDVAAYLDWAALRMATELEYEKAGRGPYPNALVHEYAWGTTAYTAATGISSPGKNIERASPSNANSVCCDVAGVQGPLRTGFAATTLSGRVDAGAGFYGNMELTGNALELLIGLMTPEGRAYTGGHGDGKLDIVGKANIPGWPSTADTKGVMWRGGSWEASIWAHRLSDRWNACFGRIGVSATERFYTLGLRAARTAP